MAASSNDSMKSKNLMKACCFRYIPSIGCASSLLFSTNVTCNDVFKRTFSPCDHIVANCLWVNSHLGVGLYIYGRPHIRSAPLYSKIMFSVFGSVIFNFGSLVVWATTKNLLPRCSHVRFIFGVITGVTLYAIGHEYLRYVDSKCIKNETNED